MLKVMVTYKTWPYCNRNRLWWKTKEKTKDNTQFVWSVWPEYEHFHQTAYVMFSKHIIISLLMSPSTQSQYIHMNSTTDTITVRLFAICKACSWDWCSVAEDQAKANRGVFLIWLLTHCCYRVNTETRCSANQRVVFFRSWLNMWMIFKKCFTFLKHFEVNNSWFCLL